MDSRNTIKVWTANGLFALIAGMLWAVASAEEPAQPPKPTVGELIKNLHNKPVKERTQVFETLIKGAPDTLNTLSDLLVKPGTGNDTAARFAIRNLSYHVMRPKAPDTERQAAIKPLLELLTSQKDVEIKAFVIGEIQYIGRDEAVGPVSNFLLDARLGAPSTQTLLAISKHAGREEISNAVRAALPEAKETKATLIRALGALRDRQAVEALTAEVSNEDAGIRRMALYALAAIADPASGDVLLKVTESENVTDRQKATSWYLLYARRLAEDGNKDKAAEICRRLYQARTGPVDGHVQSSALITLHDILGENAIDDLVAALDSKSTYVRAAVSQRLARASGGSVSEKVGMKIDSPNREIRAEVLKILARRGEKSALAAVSKALEDKDVSIRLQAIKTLARVLKEESLPKLFEIVAEGSGEERKTAQILLYRIPGDKVTNAIAEQFETVELPVARTAIIEVLQKRGARKHLDVLHTAAADKDKAVRAAAFKALKTLAGPDQVPAMLELLLKTAATEQDALIQAIVVASNTSNEETRIVPVLKILPSSKGKDRIALLKLLSHIGGTKALEPVVADLKSEDKAVLDAALRSLADWPDMGAAPELLKVIKESDDLVHKVLSLRGYVRITSASKVATKQKVKMFREAIDAAPRPDDKKLVLGGLSSIRSIEALQLAAKFLDDEALQAEAVQAVVKIACPQNNRDKGLRGAPVFAALQEVIKHAKNKDLKKKAENHLTSFPEGDPFNLAIGRPVKSSLKSEGHRVPQLAVDGRIDPSFAWFGAGSPGWLQVDLQKKASIDTAQVFFYVDGHRYYQYSIEVSVDGKKWEEVVERLSNTDVSARTGFTHKFDPIESRYVRLHVTKNSANPSVHVLEFKIYAEGNGPPILNLTPNESPKGAPKSSKTRKATPAPPAVAKKKNQKAVNPSITPYALHKKDAQGKATSGIAEEEFTPLFDGKTLKGWQGSTKGYFAENGLLVCKGGRLFTEKEYSDFVFRFEFKLPPGANNGLGIRSPLQGDPAYSAMELQILENTHEKYARLQPYQYHGSIYGVVPAKRGFQNKPGEWNSQEVIAIGHHIKVILNGEVITDAFIDKIKSMDGRPHPGLLNKKGFLGFLGHGSRIEFRNIHIKDFSMSPPLPATTSPNTPPPGFTALFNGEDLTGWKGLVKNPKVRAQMKPEQLAEAQKKADEIMRKGWSVEDGVLVFGGRGQSLCTAKDYADFEMYVDWKIHNRGDSGIYLRGSPQVQIWDTNQWKIGSGGLYNNKKNPSKPTAIADNPIGEWNTFFIRMIGENVTIYLNGKLIVDDVTLENYWERNKPIYRSNQIELQNHGNKLYFKNIYIRELPY